MGIRSFGNIHVDGNLELRHGLSLQPIGHQLATQGTGGEQAFVAHSVFNGGVTEHDTQIVNISSFFTRQVFQPDESGEFTGTSLDKPDTGVGNTLVSKFYFKTGATAATQPVKIQSWLGAADSGTLIFQETYPASKFPAYSEIELDMPGYSEFNDGANYVTRISSDANFSLKTDVANLLPWIAADILVIREDNLLQTKEYIDGDSWTEGDYFIDSRTIYICNTTGTQTGTFASNSSLWDKLDAGIQTDRIISPDSVKTLIATDTPTLTYYDGTFNRLLVNNAFSATYSPNSTTVSFVSDNSIQDTIAGNVRLLLDGAASKISSPDTFSSITLSNSDYNMVVGGNTYLGFNNGVTTVGRSEFYGQLQIDESGAKLKYWGLNALRLEISNTKTKFLSRSGVQMILEGDRGWFTDDAGDRMIEWGTVGGIKLTAPDKNSAINVHDDVFKYTDPNRIRLESTSTYTAMIGPNGTNSLLVDTSGAFYNNKEIATVSDITIVSIRTSTGTIAQGENIGIGVLSANITLTIDSGVTRFKIRDLNSNIGTYTVTLVMDSGVDELILAIPRDHVSVDKHSSVWYYYNFRNGIGEKI